MTTKQKILSKDIWVSILAGTPVGSTIVAVQIIAFGLSWLAGTVIGGVRK